MTIAERQNFDFSKLILVSKLTQEGKDCLHIKIDYDSLDSDFAPAFKNKIVELSKKKQKVFLDLQQVKYADSSGLSALLVGNRQFQAAVEEDDGFSIYNVTDHVNKLILISQLDKILHFASPLQELDFVPEFEQIGITYTGNGIRCVRLNEDGIWEALDPNGRLHHLLYSYTTDSQSLKHQIEEFEYLINQPNTKEVQLHDFFNRHPNFILNDDYRKAHSKIILESEDDKLIPDFVLEPYGSNKLSDLVELKLPKTKAYVLKKNRLRFSAAVHEAVAQVKLYSDFFDDKRNRERFKNEYGLEIYRPRMIIVLGRSPNVDNVSYKKIMSTLPPGLEVVSYDKIADRMKGKIS